VSRTRRLLGGALVASGVALSLITLRSLAGERAHAEAGVRVLATHGGERDVAELRAIEAKVQAAAELRPLVAALAAQVDSATLLDLLDNEDWWRPYRDEFAQVRVIVGERVIAARGAATPSADEAAVVRLARTQLVGSARTTIGGQPYQIAAARLSVLPDEQPVLVLGQRVLAPAAAAVAPQAGGGRAAHPLPWAIAAAIGLGGVGLLATGRRQRSPAAAAASGAVVAAAPREATLKFGTKREQLQVSGATVRPPPRPTGRVFGRYRLLDRLGEGGMSELFLAEASGVAGFTRAFVLKRLRPELARDKEAVAQFIDEARLQANLVHSNIVPVFDFGVVDSEYFMTQEYIVGRDLARVMDRHAEQDRRGLPAPLAYFIAHETLQALAYAHTRHDRDGSPLEIVHRDVSPGNIMVSMAGEVKLADFGIVKSNTQNRVSRTQVGMVKGNANFMSPEQARGHAVDGRSDLYSLALGLYYCLSGELMYSGDNDLEVLYRAAGGLTADDVARIRRLADPAPQILERALALDPGQRFDSAQEFADALALHMGGGRAALTRLMQQLFARDERRETA
jgi:hypothetical protein